MDEIHEITLQTLLGEKKALPEEDNTTREVNFRNKTKDENQRVLADAEGALRDVSKVLDLIKEDIYYVARPFTVEYYVLDFLRYRTTLNDDWDSHGPMPPELCSWYGCVDGEDDGNDEDEGLLGSSEETTENFDGDYEAEGFGDTEGEDVLLAYLPQHGLTDDNEGIY